MHSLCDLLLFPIFDCTFSPNVRKMTGCRSHFKLGVPCDKCFCWFNACLNYEIFNSSIHYGLLLVEQNYECYWTVWLKIKSSCWIILCCCLNCPKIINKWNIIIDYYYFFLFPFSPQISFIAYWKNVGANSGTGNNWNSLGNMTINPRNSKLENKRNNNIKK